MIATHTTELYYLLTKPNTEDTVCLKSQEKQLGTK